MVAEWQNIVYGEYLPVILGKEAMSRHKVSLPRGDSYTNYDPNLNPGIRNSFATAAYRFGHSQASKKRKRWKTLLAANIFVLDINTFK